MNKVAKNKKPRCWNCKHGSQSFKIADKTHLHCLNQDKYPDADMESGKICPWDTLMEGYYTCDKHEFKPSPKDTEQLKPLDK